MDGQNLPVQNPAFPQQPNIPVDQQGYTGQQVPGGAQPYWGQYPVVPPAQSNGYPISPMPYVDPNTGMQGQQQAPVPQAVPSGGSPEIPSQMQGSEQLTSPDRSVEQSPTRVSEQSSELGTEQAEKSSQAPAETSVKAPEKVPDQKTFESPYKLYGYKISPQTVQKGASDDTTEAKGDIGAAKTWLKVLLTRLLKMYKGREVSVT